MIYLYAFIVGIYEAIWRRSHGGGLFHNWYDEYIKPWLKLNYRIPSVLVNSIVFFLIGYSVRGLVWWQALIFTLIVWLFWDITFGMYMGIGKHPYPNTEDKDEYDHQYPVVWILNPLFKDNHDPIWGRYGAAYDFCGMWIRFTYPLVPLLFLPTFTPWILSLGLLIALNYYLENWVISWWNAELGAGFVAGVFFVLL